MSEAHSHPGDGKQRDLSGHGEKNRLCEAHSRSGAGRQKDLSGHGRKKTDRAMGMDTHKLKNAGERPSRYIEMCESSKRLIIETSAWNGG